ncbi:MAG: hypothetical protein NTX29_04565 [Actinobacteria bacterium]|nr:hypothetical protein [Actinomycetota bacterium]
MRRIKELAGTVAALLIIIAPVTSAAPAAFADGSSEPRFTVEHAFGNAPGDGWQPWGSPTLLNGRLWGRTTYGGSHNQGAVIWSMVPGKPKTYRVEHSFGGRTKAVGGGMVADVANPHHDWLRIGPDGRTLYGAALWGSDGGQGGVFSFDTESRTYRVLHGFSGIGKTNPAGEADEGTNPHSNPVPIEVVDSRGLKATVLIGMTAAGGAEGSGSLYRMDLDGSHFRLLHSFVPAAGAVPHGFVIQRGSRIYGMTRLGGITPAASAFASAADFSNYAEGNGVVFRYDLNSGAYRILHSFSYAGPLATPSLPGGVVDGAVPDHGGLVFSNNRLWGLTTQGGTNGGGVAFSMKLDGSDYRINHTFGAPILAGDLSQPHGTLMPGPNGMLYALTSFGGATASGGVLRVNPRNGNYRLVYSFPAGAGGVDGIDNPVVTTDARGRIVLYGMTKLGGAVQSSLLPAPIAADWKLPQPAQANGVIWRLVL